MKRWVLGVAAVFLLVPGLQAQEDAAKRAKVEELFTVMRLDQTMSKMMDLVQRQIGMMTRSLPGMDKLTPEQQKTTEEFQKKAMDLALSTVSWKSLEPDMVRIYATSYSDQEIDGLITFYRSPVGQTMLDKQPDLAQATMQVTQQRVLALQPKLQELTEEYRKQLGLPGAAPLTAPPPAPAKSSAQPQ